MAQGFVSKDGAIPASIRILDEGKSTLEADLASLTSKLSSIGSQWQGDGADSFVKVMARWNADSKRLIGALDNFKETLRVSDQSYQATDTAAADSLNRLAARLG